MEGYRVVVVRDLSQQWEEPDAEKVVCAVTAHAAAVQVLRSLGGGFTDCIEVHSCASRSLRVRYLYCNLFAGEFTYDVCCVPRTLSP